MEFEREENSRLLPVSYNSDTSSMKNKKCSIALGCVKSKAARLILLWNFSAMLVYNVISDTKINMQVDHVNAIPVAMPIFLSLIVVLSPLAGLLTDIKLSRYKVVVSMSYLIICVVAVIVILVTIEGSVKFFYWRDGILVKVSVSLAAILMLVTSIVLIINALQFGMDQLHDSSTEDSILFIHWYVWTNYVSILFTEVAWNLIAYDSFYFTYFDNLRKFGLIVAAIIAGLILLLLIVLLNIVHHKKVWFLIEPARNNPYKLVYKVLKFAYQHKSPLRRSAFTYCEDEIPSRIDFGKQKYGGPFTTKEVEDVKAFLGILKMLLSIGPVFMLQTATDSLLPVFAKHGNIYVDQGDNHTVKHVIHPEGVARHIFISNGLLSSLIVVFGIPFYVFLIRPSLSFRIPGMLKRIGLGIVVMILSLICILAIDVAVHAGNSNRVECMFRNHYPRSEAIQSLPMYQNLYFLISQLVLAAFFNALIDIAILEFICSQSPYSMKGLLLGIFISTKSLFQTIEIAFIVPFGISWNIRPLSCESGYYIMNIALGVMALALLTIMAKKYKYRTVNEPSNEYRYAEEYYSNIQ